MVDCQLGTRILGWGIRVDSQAETAPLQQNLSSKAREKQENRHELMNGGCIAVSFWQTGKNSYHFQEKREQVEIQQERTKIYLCILIIIDLTFPLN